MRHVHRGTGSLEMGIGGIDGEIVGGRDVSVELLSGALGRRVGGRGEAGFVCCWGIVAWPLRMKEAVYLLLRELG